MPINVNENHWVLLVTNVKEKTVTVMDSMNGKDGQRYAGIWRYTKEMFETCIVLPFTIKLSS